MSKITNDSLTRSDKGCFIGVPLWQYSGRQRVNGKSYDRTTWCRCHTGSRNVTCHPTRANTLRLNPSQ